MTRLGHAVERLRGDLERIVAKIVLDFVLPDRQRLSTLEPVLRITPNIPLPVVSAERDDNKARQGVQSGAQDYLLWERLDAYSLSKALAGALQRSAKTEAPQAAPANSAIRADVECQSDLSHRA